MPNWQITGVTNEGDPLDLIAEGDWEDVADYIDCLRAEGAREVRCVEAPDAIPARYDETICAGRPKKLYRRDGSDIPQ